MEIESELDLYHNNAGAYGEAGQTAAGPSHAEDLERALLAERLATIDRATDERLR